MCSTITRVKHQLDTLDTRKQREKDRKVRFRTY